MSTATTEALKLTERINRIEPSATMAVVAEADKLRGQGIDVVDFGAGEPHFATPQHIKDAAIAAIQGNFTKYTAVAGTAELRDAMVNRHDQDFGSGYRREEVIASVGGKHALFNAIQVLVDHGDEVILPVPYWVSFKDIIRYAGGNCVLLESNESQGFRVTADMVAARITPKTKAIILNSPANPSGAVMTPEDMTEVVRLAHERGIWVLSDECYVYLNYTGKNFSVGSLRDYKEHIVVLGSLSKTYAMTGWRLGYALAPAAVIHQDALGRLAVVGIDDFPVRANRFPADQPPCAQKLRAGNIASCPRPRGESPSSWSVPTALQKTFAYARGPDPTRSWKSHTKPGCVRWYQNLRRELRLHAIHATAGPPSLMPISDHRVRTTTTLWGRHRTRLPASCRLHPGSSADPGPHDRAA